MTRDEAEKLAIGLADRDAKALADWLYREHAPLQDNLVVTQRRCTELLDDSREKGREIKRLRADIETLSLDRARLRDAASSQTDVLYPDGEPDFQMWAADLRSRTRTFEGHVTWLAERYRASPTQRKLTKEAWGQLALELFNRGAMNVADWLEKTFGGGV